MLLLAVHMQVKKVTMPVAPRKAYWFERFHWFVTSENVLVLSGRDAQQNELLVKRHLGKGDLYVHADLHGASTTIVKAPAPDQPGARHCVGEEVGSPCRCSWLWAVMIAAKPKGRAVMHVACCLQMQHGTPLGQLYC